MTKFAPACPIFNSLTYYGTFTIQFNLLWHIHIVVAIVNTRVSVVSSSHVHPLSEAGNAVLDVLTGVYNPAGRTVVTWYTGNSQLPPMTNYSMVNRTYRYMKATPFYKFGYGLSYTKFNYSNFVVSVQSYTLCMW